MILKNINILKSCKIGTNSSCLHFRVVIASGNQQILALSGRHHDVALCCGVGPPA